MRRVGILGGTFDPIHIGHLIIAQEAWLQLGLEQVLFIPAHTQPLKQGEKHTRASARLEMVRLATADNPRFEVSTIELERGGTSYTADTLAELHRREPDTAWHFIIGVDALNQIRHWRAPESLITLTRLGVAARPGYDLDLAALDAELPGLSKVVDMVNAPQIDIASHDLRARVAAGQPITYWIPAAVEEFIRREGLYQAD